MGLVNGLLDGSEAALHQAFRDVEKECRDYDRREGQSDIVAVIEAWGEEELRLLRGRD